jgi:putative transposase
MPRLPRLHVPGGFYHVMLRGNHREDLFVTPADRWMLNDIVGEVFERLGGCAHAFCWMTNHLHLLIQIGERPLGQVMQRIAMRYSRYRHKQLRTTGHLFERRYKAKLVEMDAYVFALLRYIHLNPVAAGMVASADDYPWSSHHAYLGKESHRWLTTELALGLFGSTVTQAQASYTRWMAQEIYASESRLWDEVHPDDSRVLGGDKFLNTLPPFKFTPRSQITLPQLVRERCGAHGVTIESVCSPSRRMRLSKVRVDIAQQATAQRIASLHEVARYLNRSPSSLSELLTRYSKASEDTNTGK